MTHVVLPESSSPTKLITVGLKLKKKHNLVDNLKIKLNKRLITYVDKYFSS